MLGWVSILQMLRGYIELMMCGFSLHCSLLPDFLGLEVFKHPAYTAPGKAENSGAEVGGLHFKNL